MRQHSFDGVYFDADDVQNTLTINGENYVIENEHLTERGSIKTAVNGIDLVFSIDSGDTKGLKPYVVTINFQTESFVTIRSGGRPFLNSSGRYLRWLEEMGDPSEILAQFSQSESDLNREATDTLLNRAISTLQISSDADELIPALESLRGFTVQFGGSILRPVLPRLKVLSDHEDKKVAYRAKKLVLTLGG